MLHALSDLAGLIATIFAALFLLTYLTLFNWRKTWAGVAIVILISTLLAFGLYSTLPLFFGAHWWHREAFHLAVNIGLLAAIIILNATLWVVGWRHHTPHPDVPGAQRASHLE